MPQSLEMQPLRQAVLYFTHAGKKLRPPSLADEAVLLKYYKSKVQDMCRAFGFPSKVQVAAITFLARFYLRHSPLEHDVKDTTLVCLYLAGKVGSLYCLNLLHA